jgi:hypothetical protein
MTIRVHRSQAFLHNIQTRMPFRYGIAEMTAVPHLFLQLTCEIDGQQAFGVAADNLIPKWFTKDPHTSYENDLQDMRAVIQKAGEFAVQAGSVSCIFELWKFVYQAQRAWASEPGYPPLLWNFGVSLVERALIDVFCRVKGITFVEALRENTLGVNLKDIHPELVDYAPAELLPKHPLREINIRHTIGLSDVIAEDEILPEQRLNDGLPQSLEANIRTYGIRYFKIKVSGNVDVDAERLCRIDSAFEKCGVNNYYFTLDGNEQYKNVLEFRAFWEQITHESACSPYMERLLFVEQPFHRQVALSDETIRDLLSWNARPLMIIDESDAEIKSMRTALESGYAGTSHKNCKGIFKSVANACLLTYMRKLEPNRKFILSGEDLANVGPVALLQDLIVMSVLGIKHVERNGHHYFAGLKAFPVEVQQQLLYSHQDLYHQPTDFPTLKISNGSINIASLLQSPFGLKSELLPELWFQPEDSWKFESLRTQS